MRPLIILIKTGICTYKIDSSFKEYLSFFACLASQFRWTRPGQVEDPTSQGLTCDLRWVRVLPMWLLPYLWAKTPFLSLRLLAAVLTTMWSNPARNKTRWHWLTGCYCACTDLSLTSGLWTNYILLFSWCHFELDNFHLRSKAPSTGTSELPLINLIQPTVTTMLLISVCLAVPREYFTNKDKKRCLTYWANGCPPEASWEIGEY